MTDSGSFICTTKNEVVKSYCTCVPPDLSAHSNGSDCGYSSSLEGSETGSREGSDVACSEGICNHDEAGCYFVLFFCRSSNWFRAQNRNSSVSYNHIFFSLCLLCAGDYLHTHHCAEDKEEDGTDSCVDCWPHSEGKVQCKSKKKKRKPHSLCNNQVRAGQTRNPTLYAPLFKLFNWLCTFPQGKKGEGCTPDGNTSAHSSLSPHMCRTKEVFSNLCGDTFDSSALQLPWTVCAKNCMQLHAGTPNISLVELLVSAKYGLKHSNLWQNINQYYTFCALKPNVNPHFLL